MERSQKYIIGFIFYEIVIAVCELAYFCVNNSGKSSNFMYSLPAYITSFQGLWDLVIIVYCNWADIRKEYLTRSVDRSTITAQDVARENLLLCPHLNAALRGEILYFVTRGITYSTQHPSREIAHSTISFHDYIKTIRPVSFRNGRDTTDSNRYTSSISIVLLKQCTITTFTFQFRYCGQ